MSKPEPKKTHSDGVRDRIAIAKELLLGVISHLDKAAADVESEDAAGWAHEAHRDIESLPGRLQLVAQEVSKHQAIAWRARKLLADLPTRTPPEQMRAALDRVIDELYTVGR